MKYNRWWISLFICL